MFKNYKKIFFIGIGGIEMNSLAKYFLNIYEKFMDTIFSDLIFVFH